MSPRRPGALALVLHSHMPYVEGFGTWPFGEEWLWEAVACVYLPLLELLDGAPVTVGLTPVLCDQLEAMRGEPGERYLRFLREIRAAIHAEDAAGLERGGEPELAAEVRRAAGDYEFAEQAFERRGRDLLGAFAGARPGGAVDLGARPTRCCRCSPPTPGCACSWPPAPRRTCAASASGAAASGCRSAPTRPGLERDLADHGVRAFCVDQTAVPGFDHLRPVATEAGPGGRADRLADGRAGLERPRRLPGRTAPTATTTAARCTTSSPGTTPATPTTARPRWRSRASTRATSSSAPPRARGRTAGCSAARSTPSCSATGGTRGRPGWRPCWRRRRARGSSWSR